MEFTLEPYDACQLAVEAYLKQQAQGTGVRKAAKGTQNRAYLECLSLSAANHLVILDGIMDRMPISRTESIWTLAEQHLDYQTIERIFEELIADASLEELFTARMRFLARESVEPPLRNSQYFAVKALCAVLFEAVDLQPTRDDYAGAPIHWRDFTRALLAYLVKGGYPVALSLRDHQFAHDLGL